MKSNTLLFFSFLLFVTTPISSYEQPVNVTDSLALVDLYNNTNGRGWTRKTNWLSINPISTWQGVTVTGSRVTSLSLPLNNLAGNLPSSIGNLSELTVLYFYFNNLSGNIPASIGNLTKLIQLDLSNNKLSGTLPSSIGSLVNINLLYLNGNGLTGSIPSTIGNLAKATFINLYSNDFSGSIPSTIGNLANAYSIDLSGNSLTGSIPASIGNLKKLFFLKLYDNLLSGSIPFSIGGMDSLNGLDLHNNQLTGAIPNSIGQASKIDYINFSFNQLSGSLPASIGNLKLLVYLLISDNRFTGPLPASIRKLESLGNMDIRNNLFTDAGYIDIPVNGKRRINGSIENNHFTFNTAEYVSQKFPFLGYDQQLPIPIHQNGNTLSVSAGGKLSNNTYKWYKVGNALPVEIAGDSTFEPSENGDYYAEVTNAVASLLMLKTDTITFTAVTADKENQKLDIYPNPVRNVLTINGFDKTHSSTITIADVSGNVKLRTTVKQQVSVQINVASLRPGNYILFSISNGKTVSVNFIKQ